MINIEYEEFSHTGAIHRIVQGVSSRNDIDTKI